MKEIRDLRNTKAFLVLLVLAMSLLFGSISNAQTKNQPSNLVNTIWETPVTLVDGMVSLQFWYEFKANQKVECHGLAIQNPVLMPQAQPEFPGSGNLVLRNGISPTGSAASTILGTFKQTGKSIRIEFSDYFVIATLNDNSMEGEIIYKDKSKGKGKWLVAKVAKDSKDFKGEQLPNGSVKTDYDSPEDRTIMKDNDVLIHVLEEYNKLADSKVAAGDLKAALEFYDGTIRHYSSLLSKANETFSHSSFVCVATCEISSFYESPEYI
jgi:hypothetical protein